MNAKLLYIRPCYKWNPQRRRRQLLQKIAKQLNKVHNSNMDYAEDTLLTVVETLGTVCKAPGVERDPIISSIQRAVEHLQQIQQDIWNETDKNEI